MIGARIILLGIVQGVGYRWFAQDNANIMGLAGWVRNRMDGNVEVLVEGEKEIIQAFIEKLRSGPRFARVEDVDVEWREATGKLTGFTIRH